MQIDGKSTVDKRIAGAFKAAGDATGTSFRYLLDTAARESDIRPDLAADTSSAKGLFQFVDQTWLELIRREGPSVGLERLAEKIVPDGKGGWTVADPADKAKILALKTDPLTSAVMAGRFAQDNARRLTDSLGRAPSDGELYAAHVLGAAGATKLIRLAGSEPNTSAAVVFPRAAAANPGLFYGKGGAARSVSDLLGRLTAPRDPAADPTSARIAEAHAALTASGARDDGSRVALVLRAQAAALVAGEAAGGAKSAAATPGAAERTLLRTALAEKPIPGAAGSATETAAQAGRLDGWRSRIGRDAFADLMRSDAAGADATAAWDARALPGASRLAPAAAAGLTAATAAPTATPTAGTPTAGTPTAATPATPPLLPPVPEPAAKTTAAKPSATATAAPRARALGGAVLAGGGAGGIVHVDPNAPLSLVAAPTASPAVAAVEQATGHRPSRLLGLASGAPAAPLPVREPGADGTRPSRLLFDRLAEPSLEAIEAGAVRVRTTAITPPALAAAPAVETPAPAAATPTAAAPTLETPAAPAAEPRGPRRGSRRPLDLIAASQGRTPAR